MVSKREEVAAGLRRFWDGKYQADEPFYGTEPNAWLAANARLLPSTGEALALADGQGRNGVWLAERGLRVTSVDVSPRAAAATRALAAERGVEVEAVEADLRSWGWPEGRFDVAVAIFAHFPPGARTEIHRSALASLKPGGLFLLEAYTPYQLLKVEQGSRGGPKDMRLLYTAGRLLRDFADAEILHLEETETTLDEGAGHQGSADVVRLIARRR